MQKIEGTVEAWENGDLGRDEDFVEVYDEGPVDYALIWRRQGISAKLRGFRHNVPTIRREPCPSRRWGLTLGHGYSALRYKGRLEFIGKRWRGNIIRLAYPLIKDTY